MVVGKKSWGLWLSEFTDGVCDSLFTKEEVLKQFEDNNIKIPESFLLDFENTLLRKKVKRNEKEKERLREVGLM